MRYPLWIIFMLLAFCRAPVLGQQLQFDNISNNMQLPSQETYNIMQDSKGYIWFSTEQGLCRYNGSSLQVFDSTNGLPEGAVYAIVEDRWGRLWMVTSQNRILVYENDTLKEAEFSETYKKMAAPLSITYALHIVGNNKLYINSLYQTFIADLKTATVKQVTGEKSPNYALMRKENRIVPMSGLHSITGILREAAVSQTMDINLENDGKVNVLKVAGEFAAISGSPIRTTGTYKGYTVFSIGNILVKLYADGTYEDLVLPEHVLCVYLDNDGGIWAGLANDGLYYYAFGNISKEPVKSLRDLSVSGIVPDHEKNIWCTTLEQGVYLCINKNILNYSHFRALSRPVDLMKTLGATSYFSGQGEIFRLDNGHFSTFKPNSLTKAPVKDIVAMGNKFLVATAGLTFYCDTNFKNPEFVYINSLPKFRAISGKPVSSDGYFFSQLILQQDAHTFLVSFKAILELRNNIALNRYEYYSRLRCAGYLGGDFYLFGCNDGLYRTDIIRKQSAKIKGITHPVSRIVVTADKKAWVATKGGGLYFYDAGLVRPMNAVFQVPTKVLYDIAEKDGVLWIACNKGLLKIDTAAANPKAQLFGSKEGLPSNDVYKMTINGTTLFLSTAAGLCSFSINSTLKNTAPPNIYLSEIRISGQLENVRLRQLKLKHDQNDLHLVFDILAFKEKQKRLYFILSGQEQQSGTLEGNALTFQNLPPGHFKLVVYALNSSGVKSISPIVFSFDIVPPFWLSWWFITLLAVAGILMVYLIIRQNKNKVRRAEAEKTRIHKLIADSQLMALQAQMNPHFIFNAINSIQSYILDQKEQEAYDFLAKFSKLIRMVLSNSEQRQLSLHEELETLQLYVGLEQLRFKEQFDFELVVDSKADIHLLQLPTMLLQPFIENAIWHGLMNLKGVRHGKITLAIDLHEDMLRIAVTDNGVGRVQAAQYNKNSIHRPFAIGLTAQRLAIVNQLYKDQSVKCDITDLYAADGTAAGTQVVLLLPVVNND